MLSKSVYRSFHAVSFADYRLRRSKNRLTEQAQGFPGLRSLVVYDQAWLPASYTSRFDLAWASRTRGFGYWSWKPFIIRDRLVQLPPDAPLVYLDVGCHLNPQGSGRMQDYLLGLEISEPGIVAFAMKPSDVLTPDLQSSTPVILDLNFVKGDLAKFFGLNFNSAALLSPTTAATVILLRNNPAALGFLDKWIEVMTFDLGLLDDSPSANENPPGFVEHRHDQAIFSLLCKQYGIPTLSFNECWLRASTEKIEVNWAALQDFPIHARRDLDFGPGQNLTRKMRKIYSRGMAANLRRILRKLGLAE